MSLFLQRKLSLWTEYMVELHWSHSLWGPLKVESNLQGFAFKRNFVESH